MERRLRQLLDRGGFGKVDPVRSRTMRAIRSENTTPEIVVRSMIHRMGVRFRLHRRDLPGRPDIVMPGRHRIVEVRGCFWHGHNCHLGRRSLHTNRPYWIAKRSRTRRRDARNLKELEELGWRVLIVWECETSASGLPKLRHRVRRFMSDEAVSP